MMRNVGNGNPTWITNYIWGIADDVLRDLYVRGKYRDVLLPMTVLRRLGAVLEGSKQAVLDMKALLDTEDLVKHDSALRNAGGQPFYNTSKFTLHDLRGRSSRQQLTDDFRAYLAAQIRALKETGARSEDAPRVIRKIHRQGIEPDLLRGRFESTVNGRPATAEYEPDTDLRDTEQVPLTEEGGIETFLKREVLLYAPDAWYLPDKAKVGYKISFTRHFYKPQPMHSPEEIRVEILALERESEGLLSKIVDQGAR